MKQRNKSNFRKPYSATPIRVPNTNIIFYYVYHYKLQFGAVFERRDNIEKFIDGYERRSYGSLWG